MRKLISIVFVCAFTLSCLLAVNFSSQTAKADTTVSSDITTDTIWYAASSPYIISTNVAVTSGVTLTIEPGVTVKFSSGTKLTVAGNLNAVGTSISMINFTSSKTSPAAGDYNTIKFTGGSTSTFIMNYCNVQYATNGVTLASPSGGRYTINNSEISHNKNSGIFISQSNNRQSVIENNQITSNPTDIDSYAFSLSNITITGNTISSATNYGIHLYSDATVTSHSGRLNNESNIFNVDITSNTVTGAHKNGIYLYAYAYTSGGIITAVSNIYNVNITGNTVTGSTTHDIYIDSDARAPNTHSIYTNVYDINITGNTVTGAGGNGIYILSEANIASCLFNINIAENNVTNNGGVGIDCFGSDGIITIISNNIESNSQGFVTDFYGPGVLTAVYANITKNTICHNTNEGVYFGDWYNYPGNMAHYNDIYSNGYGMTVPNGATVNATYNWWGDSSGPYNAISNPSGTGNPTDSDNLNLTFIPWLTAPFNTAPPNNSAPNTPSAPTGPASVYAGVLSQYTVTATDPDGDMIRYGWDWNGDGVVDEWSGLVPSGTSDVRSHSWSSAGVYNVSVIVEDQYGAQSGWSGKLQVTVQNAPVPEFSLHVLIVTVSVFTAIFIVVTKRKKMNR